jgi:hypothetical protein|tara:strand:+ start:898 stop:1545 length:648 start_codon:yes stop_codon:yes gene_type:complete
MFQVDEMKAMISKKGGFAMANQFRVILPAPNTISRVTDRRGNAEDIRDLNLLCKDVNLPGRQILTQERVQSMAVRKVAYGYGQEDVSMTFHVMNDYGIKRYFENWHDQIIDFERKELKYKNTYTHDIEIIQYKKGAETADISKTSSIGFDINDKLRFDLDITKTRRGALTPAVEVYKCKLINAFPTTLNAIQLNNEQNGLLEINVQFSYDDWVST